MSVRRPDPARPERNRPAGISLEAAVLTPESPSPPEPLEPLALTRRQIHLDVWNLAWPSVITMLLQTVNSLLDSFFVGHLPNGRQALAATGAGGMVLFLMVSLAMGVTVGTTALVARFTGAQEPEQATLATGQSLTLGAFLGLLFGVLTYASRDAIARLLLNAGQNPEAAILCAQFLGMALLGAVPMFVSNVFYAAFRGIGDTRTLLMVMIVTIATHVSLNFTLIYGRFGMPRMGVGGAGLAFACSNYVGVALFLLLLRYHPVLAEALRWKNLKLRMEWMGRILRIGLPAALQAVIRTLGLMSFTGMLAHTVEKDAAVAAMQIGIRGESIAFMPGFGYSVAASALVGQSLGAHDPERAERYGWAATLQAIVVMTFMATLFFLFAGPFAALFADDALVRLLGAQYLQINAFCEPFLALGMVLTGALQGAGDTVRPTYITALTMWVLRMPLGYWMMFVLHLETRGAWLAMASTTIIGGLMMAALFRSGKWKRIKV